MFSPLFCMIRVRAEIPFVRQCGFVSFCACFFGSAGCQKTFLLDKAGFCSAFSVARHTIARARMAGKTESRFSLLATGAFAAIVDRGMKKY